MKTHLRDNLDAEKQRTRMANTNRFGTTPTPVRTQYAAMSDFSFPSSRSNDVIFDAYDKFVPEPGPFLDDQNILSQDRCIAFHRLMKLLFKKWESTI